MISDLVANKQSVVNAPAPYRLAILNRQGDQVGSLRLVNHALADDNNVLADLTAWRRNSMRYFLTHFEPSQERTRRWLLDTAIPSIDRLFFLLETDPGFFIGNIGVTAIGSSSAELDNLLRGRRGGSPDFIYLAECALLWWLFADCERDTATLRVFSNNSFAISLHLTVGFSKTGSDPLFVHPAGQEHGYTLQKAGVAADFTYDEMTITRSSFHACNEWVVAAFQSPTINTHGSGM